MSRLPTVGGDSGSWGTVLNEYLQTEHNEDGTHTGVEISSDNADIDGINLNVVSEDPATPGTGHSVIYAKSGGLYLINSSNTVVGPLGTGGSSSDYILIKDQKTQNSSGGTFTLGAWRVRDLNTEAADTGNHASVASNQITLAAGTYRTNIICPASGVDNHQARLFDTTASTVLVIGTSSWSHSLSYANTPSYIVGRFTLGVQSVLQVEHYCSTTRTTYGFGLASNFGTEVYTIAEFWKE